MTVVAIDFGTSNTAIAILTMDRDRSITIPKTLHFDNITHGFETNEGTAWLVPSLVYVLGNETDYGEFLFGEQARSQYLLENQSKRLFQGFKRDIVASFRSPAREIDGKLYDAEVIAEVFLTELWQRLLLQDIQPTQLIFTVPVGAFEAYLNWFSNFAERLQVPNFQIIDESTASALGYAITRPNALVLVIDFGGGTLDLSLVRTAPITNATNPKQVNKAEAIAKSDAYIGGIDIDRWIAEHFLRQLGSTRSQIGEASWLSILEISVAHGALVLGQEIAVVDHLRHSYAIRLWEPYLHQYSFYTLFEKGTKYPCQRPEPLILQAAIAGQTEIWLDIGEVADISQAEVTYDSFGRMTSSQLLKQSDFRSLAANSKKSEVDQVCIARLDPSGQLGSDRIAVNFEIDDRRFLTVTVCDLLTDQVLIDKQAIAKLE